MNLNNFIVKAKQVFIALILALSLYFIPKAAWASEGIIELNNARGANQRCFAMSLQTNELRFNILISCVNLIYPSDTKIETYVVWANPIQPTNSATPVSPLRLGELGFGKVELFSSIPFSGLFVTLEPNNRVRTPTGTRVMQGNVQPITFLQNALVKTPTPIPTTIIKQGGIPVKSTPSTTISPTKAPTPVSNLVKAFVTFVAVILAVIIFGVIIYVIYRYRKSSV